MKLLTFVALLTLAVGCHGRKDPAAYFGLLPSLGELPNGSQLVSEKHLDGSTFVRVFASSGLALNAALRVFDNADSASAYLKRFTVSLREFAAAGSEGFRSSGIAPDSVQSDTIALPGMQSPHHTGMIARYFAPGKAILMTQAVVATKRCAVVLQVGGVADEEDIVNLLQRTAAAADKRIQSGC
jgi:hypothetical protein